MTIGNLQQANDVILNDPVLDEGGKKKNGKNISQLSFFEQV